MKNLCLFILIFLLSCNSKGVSERNAESQGVTKFSEENAEIYLPEGYKIFRLIPLNLDEDKELEYAAIVKPSGNSNFEANQGTSIQVQFFDFQDDWKLLDQYDTKMYELKGSYYISDLDTNNINEVQFETNYMYANGQVETKYFILTYENNKLTNIASYIDEYYFSHFDKKNNRLHIINWLSGDDRDGDGIPDDSGYWNCHYFQSIIYSYSNGFFVPIEELTTKKKYTFDSGYNVCDQFNFEKVLSEFGLEY